jgi:hypothetical protein
MSSGANCSHDLKQCTVWFTKVLFALERGFAWDADDGGESSVGKGESSIKRR